MGILRDDVNKCPLSEPHSTCHGVLKAVLTINMYNKGVNDPLAYCIKALLSELNR
jgi:hypothetical protein